MLGNVGEYKVNNANATTNIVELIKTYELNLGLNTLPSNFYIKKIGIKPSADCTITLNGRQFTLNANVPFELGYGVSDIYTLYASDGANLLIRYLY